MKFENKWEKKILKIKVVSAGCTYVTGRTERRR